jgi:ribonuclease BN (tRNA processing enzyme)
VRDSSLVIKQRNNLRPGLVMPATQGSRESAGANGSTRVVMLGTGTPRPDPNCSGPATAIVVNDTPYLIDFGPGVIRRATAAFESGVTGLGFGGVNIKTAFLTHLHSDHTVGYPDLVLTPWVMGRYEPIAVYGPRGIKAMTEHVLKAWQVDIDVRASGGIDRRRSGGCRVNAHEIVPGVAYQDRNVTVTAFSARHEDMVDSFGFRFDTPDRIVVISGDTTPTQALLDHSRDCDILVHEAYSMESFRKAPPQWQEYRLRAHTSSVQLAEIANAVKPSLLVIYHRSNAGGGSVDSDSEDVLLDEIRQTYKGNVVAAHDLDVF